MARRNMIELRGVPERISRAGDPLGQFVLTDDDFVALTQVTREIADKHAGGRLLSVLEGGYSLPGLTAGVRAHVEALR